MGNFKNRIYDLRKERHLSQQQLADRIGVNKQTISQYERGVREPQFEMLGILCDYFNVSADYLLGRDSVTMRLLNSDELHIVNSYRDLDSQGRQLFLERIDELSILHPRNKKSSGEDAELSSSERTDA